MSYSYKNLLVWQKAVELTVEIYRVTDHFPKSELYALTSQIRRSAVSIPANIAEGSARGYRREYCQFIRIAYASGAELETHLLIAKRLKFLTDEKLKVAEDLLDEVMKMTNALAKKLSSRS
jgi:four helix bundle protein